MNKLRNNKIIETYCVKHCCQDTPKRAVHAEGRAVSINAKIKSEDTEITDTRITESLSAKSNRVQRWCDFLNAYNSTLK